jgi:hypothetical protein
MGDRISISFKSGKDESVTLFSHWGGMAFYDEAIKYIQDLKHHINSKDSRMSRPLDRLEPCTIMVDFIRHITQNMKRVESDLYLGKDHNSGDNSDNGHHTIDVDTGRSYCDTNGFTDRAFND